MQCLNGALTPKECSIKAPAKCKTSIFIYLDGDLPSMKSKLLGSMYLYNISISHSLEEEKGTYMYI